MNLVAIIDYGMCNLDSVARAVEECGATPLVTDQPRDLARANRVILPGVGAFPDAMRHLHERGFPAALEDQVLGNLIPFLGICLGMQLLAERGYEVRETPGLGWIEGEVRRLEPTGDDRLIPHVGWNQVQTTRPSSLFEGIAAEKDFYFVHSFAVCPMQDADVLGRTPYAGGFVSAVERGSVFGVQFHPEKSQRVGFQLIRNFLKV